MYSNGSPGTNGFLLSSLPVQGQQLCLNGNVVPVVSRGLELKNNIGLVQGVGQGTVLGNIALGAKAARQVPFVPSPLPTSPQSHDTAPLGFPLSPLSRASAPAPTTPTAQELQSLHDQADQDEEATHIMLELNALQVPDEGTFARWQAAHRNKILKEASVKLASLKAAQSYVESRLDSDYAICNGVQHVPKIAEACKFYRMACGCTRTQCPYEHETTLKQYLYETRRQKVIDELIHGKHTTSATVKEEKRDTQLVLNQPVLNQQQKEAISLIASSSRKLPEPQEPPKCEEDTTSQHSVQIDDEDDDCFVVDFGGFPNGKRRRTPTPPPEQSAPKSPQRSEKREQALAILQAPRTAPVSNMQSQRDALDRQLEEFQKRTPTGKRTRREEESPAEHSSQRRKL